MCNVSDGVIMTVYADTITDVFVTWKPKALYHGDCSYCQCQGYRNIKDRIQFLIFWRVSFCNNLIIVYVLNFLFVEVLCNSIDRYV